MSLPERWNVRSFIKWVLHKPLGAVVFVAAILSAVQWFRPELYTVIVATCAFAVILECVWSSLFKKEGGIKTFFSGTLYAAKAASFLTYLALVTASAWLSADWLKPYIATFIQNNATSFWNILAINAAFVVCIFFYFDWKYY